MGEGEGEGEGEGGADGEVRDGEGLGLVTVTIIDGRTGLGGLAGVVTGGVEGRAEAAGLCVGDEAALALPGVRAGRHADRPSAEPEGGGLGSDAIRRPSRSW